jgi:outer membrane protein OmpA-like peptidoglycan-associated protein/uncharacterized surface protein with fasciclin (FAS1) repeats
MNARPVRPTPPGRYRRRILGWGAAGVVGVFAIGGPIFVNRVEDDLEGRAVEVLNAAGVGPVDAHFSGQDGELRCTVAGPVEIPDDVVETIRDLRGVSSINVAASCVDSVDGEQANDAVGDEDTASGSSDSDVPGDDAVVQGDTTTTVGTDSTLAPDLEPLPDVVASDSQFSTLAGLLGEADLTQTLAGDGPFTLFAPTNAAFEALGADVTGALARDPELLATVLLHHVVADAVRAEDLVDGDLDTLEGSAITVERSAGVVLRSGDAVATVTEPDLDASNGVAHAIDQVLLPEGLVIGDVEVGPVAVLSDGQFFLTGVVATEEQRAALVSAPKVAVDASNVIDELTVDSVATISDDTVDAFAALAAAMSSNLVNASATIADDKFTVSGIYATDEARAAFDSVVATLGVEVDSTEVIERPVADADSAATLEADLNQLVSDQPILFEPSSTTISDESEATIDRVAALASRVSGVAIVVEGYTDTDGRAASNQALSEGRARSVRSALIARGIAGDTLTIVGFGGSEPILDGAGVEDKAASRRVEFVVTASE